MFVSILLIGLEPRTGVIGNASEVVVGGSPGVARKSKKGKSETFLFDEKFNSSFRRLTISQMK